MTDQNPPPPAPAPKTPEASPTSDKVARYAAYDKTLLKYVGGVHDTKAKARDAAKDRKVKSFEIREV